MNTQRRWHAEVDILIPFHDLDPMEVVWHGNYARYFEIARCALLQQIDYDYPQMRESGYVWPVVEMSQHFVRPLRYQQTIRVAAEIVEWENRLKIRYVIRDAATGDRITRGYTVQVAVHAGTMEMRFVSPAILFEKLGLEPPCDA
ncbi:acyl-CoA thioesterase [Uliginosibacterium sp. H1]|uniref:acyl-CoA thioesterase n=1 Tax=Uliginosibacterium sp. H1 TaxID=3114757 RepID=UPI002E18BE34|nr:acyl-CoA thioesterase [Uliginosibacterium sp. H1]